MRIKSHLYLNSKQQEHGKKWTLDNSIKKKKIKKKSTKVQLEILFTIILLFLVLLNFYIDTQAFQ